MKTNICKLISKPGSTIRPKIQFFEDVDEAYKNSNKAQSKSNQIDDNSNDMKDLNDSKINLIDVNKLINNSNTEDILNNS